VHLAFYGCPRMAPDQRDALPPRPKKDPARGNDRTLADAVRWCKTPIWELSGPNGSQQTSFGHASLRSAASPLNESSTLCSFIKPKGSAWATVGELRMALRIVVVLQVPMCLEVERNVARMLGDRYDVLAKGAGDAGFVKDVWVLAGEVAYDDVGAVD
jgi:hypothetical protein